MRTAVILAASLVAFPAFAQRQYDLATTRDGSVLYFSYFLQSSGPDTKIYRWSHDAGVALFGTRPDQHLYGTQITDEGTVLYHAEPICSTGSGPGFNDCSMGETEAVIPDRQPFSLPGFLLISPNGRYGVFAPYNSGGLWVDWVTGEQIEVDFHNSTIPNVAPPFYVNQHAVANDGSFLITAPGLGVRIWSKSGEILIPATDTVLNAIISADGGTVSVTARELGSQDPVIPAYVYDLPSGRKTKFAYVVSLSEDGQTVAYLTADVNNTNQEAQAMVARSDGTGARQITNIPGGIRGAILSGDARYLYVVAGSNKAFPQTSRIQRYEVGTGAVEDIPAVQ